MQTDHSQLQDLVRRVLLPAVIGGAGGGALSAYTSAKARPEGETPEKRRQRIIRNALVGTALGGTAGAAIPTGLHMLSQPYFGAPPPQRVDQRAFGHLARNAGSYAAAGTAAGGLMGARMRDRGVAFSHLVNTADPSMGGGSEAKLRNFLNASDANRSSLINNLVSGNKLTGVAAHKARMGWNDVLSQAGYKGMPLSEMAGGTGMATRHAWEASTGGQKVLEALKQHITDHAALGKYGPSGLIARLAGKQIGGVSMTPLVERYATDFIRPGTKMLAGGRLGAMTRLGLAGGGAMLGKSVWDSMTGN